VCRGMFCRRSVSAATNSWLLSTRGCNYLLSFWANVLKGNFKAGREPTPRFTKEKGEFLAGNFADCCGHVYQLVALIDCSSLNSTEGMISIK